MKKKTLNIILVVIWFLYLVIVFLCTINKPIKQAEFKQRNESLYKNTSDTLKQSEYFK